MTIRNQIIALFIPILIVLGAVVKSEYQLYAGETWKFKISGYDPRDLLRGHYITDQVDFDWEENKGECIDKSDCCLCLKRKKDFIDLAKVSKMSCPVAVDRCDGMIREEHLSKLRKFFVPEHLGKPLEEIIRNNTAEILVAVNEGFPSVKDLLITGKPWKEEIKKTTKSQS